MQRTWDNHDFSMKFIFWSNYFKNFISFNLFFSFFQVGQAHDGCMVCVQYYLWNLQSFSIHSCEPWTFQLFPIFRWNFSFGCVRAYINWWIPIVNYKLVRISSPCTSTSLSWLYNIMFGFSQTHIRMLSTSFLCFLYDYLVSSATMFVISCS